MAPASDLFATRFNKLPQFVSPVPDPLAWGSGRTRRDMGSECICLPTNSHFGQSGGEVAGSPLPQNHSDRSRVAKHALVLGSRGHIKPDPLSLPNVPSLLTRPFNQTPDRKLANLNMHAWLLEPQLLRNSASLRQWQQELGHLKEDQPYESMRQSGPFLQSISNQVDFRAPPVKSIADFVLFLYSGQEAAAKYH